jgi:hypothetical protein
MEKTPEAARAVGGYNFPHNDSVVNLRVRGVASGPRRRDQGLNDFPAAARSASSGAGVHAWPW